MASQVSFPAPAAPGRQWPRVLSFVSHFFARCAMKRAILAWPCFFDSQPFSQENARIARVPESHAFRVRFSHGLFFDSRNVQKSETKSDTSGHCPAAGRSWGRRGQASLRFAAATHQDPYQGLCGQERLGRGQGSLYPRSGWQQQQEHDRDRRKIRMRYSGSRLQSS